MGGLPFMLHLRDSQIVAATPAGFRARRRWAVGYKGYRTRFMRAPVRDTRLRVDIGERKAVAR